MKPKYYFLLLLAMCAIWCMVGYKVREFKEQPKIDLPEEWKAISTDSLHFTPLEGFIRNDTVFIQFTGKYNP